MTAESLDIDPDAVYAESIVFLDGPQGRTRPFLGSVVRERIDSTMYTDGDKERTYGTVVQDRDSGVITGTSTTSPNPRGHHTATWTRIPDEEFASLQQEDAQKWAQVRQAAATARLTGRP